MDPARWERIQALFHDAVELPASQREAFLERAAGGDESLVADVQRLLDEDARASPLLDSDVARVAGELLGAERSPAPAPSAVGPYRIVRVLGEGGMGVVYLAERDDLGHQVAIKVLRDAWLSPARRERFAVEQRTLAQLNHPLIARLYDADTLADGTPYFAMEYVDGEPLTDFCRRHATSIPRRLELFRAVGEAVLHAHRHAVIHRDLKPSNILVKEDGSVKLLDFGIAKHLEGVDARADRTRTGLRLMTPAYAAPEQVRGEGVGMHSDVYSLGVILYELLTGELPHDPGKEPPADILRPSVEARRRNAAPETSRASWADLDVLCLTAMHADVERRYPSVEALIRDIDHFLKHEPLEARPDTFGYRAARFVGRHRHAVAATVVAAAVLAGVVGFYTVRLAGARTVAVEEAARTQRIQRFMMHVFEGGDADAGPADDLKVVELIDRGLREARALDAEPGVQAELYATLGAIYGNLGNLDQAETLLQSALDQRRKLFADDHPAIAESLVALGLLRADQARLDEAERLVREGLEMTRRTRPSGHPEVARATSALGRVLEDRGDYEGAIELLEQAVALQSGPDAPPSDLAASLTELANSHFYAGDYDVSESLNRRVLELDRRIYGDRHPHVADDLINLGAIQFNTGRYPEAEALDREALAILQAWYGDDHPETASALTILGRALVMQERHDEADEMLRRALSIQERVHGPVHPRVASALNEIGAVAMRRGRLDESEAIYRRMIDIYRDVHGDEHPLVALGTANLASVYLERKDFARAEPLLRDVVARYTRVRSVDDLNAGIARIKLGRALLGQGRFTEARDESLAGHDIVSAKADAGVSWLRAARADLVKAYEALGEPAQAAPFREKPPAP